MLAGPNYHSLSVKLLGFTVLFGLLAEILIFLPSVAGYRLDWIKDRLAAAQTAALVFEAAPEATTKAEITQKLLHYVGALTISIKKGDSRELLASWYDLGIIDVTYDLRYESSWQSVAASMKALGPSPPRTMRIIGAAPLSAEFVELVLPEKDLKRDIRSYALRILAVSLFISGVTAALLYFTLHIFFVRPLMALSENMSSFRSHPEEPQNIIEPSNRADEIGEAERTLRAMQQDLQNALRQKTHLAALGLAVAKISHDLRNILSPIQLFADQLSTLPDPSVQRFMPKILSSLDRAISLCQNTLAYGQASEPAPKRQVVFLRRLVDEMAAILDFKDIVFENAIPENLQVSADQEQMYRALLNLTRNSLQALERKIRVDGTPQERIRIAARPDGTDTLIEVMDTGPGIPPTVRKKLFQPFAVTKDTGGSGLGLAITAELIRGHGGTIDLVESAEGAHFLIRLPTPKTQKA
ncbi:MAG: HAMP domain-containing sensor histidine kinase [Pseudomonadota bacterium]